MSEPIFASVERKEPTLRQLVYMGPSLEAIEELRNTVIHEGTKGVTPEILNLPWYEVFQKIADTGDRSWLLSVTDYFTNPQKAILLYETKGKIF